MTKYVIRGMWQASGRWEQPLTDGLPENGDLCSTMARKEQFSANKQMNLKEDFELQKGMHLGWCCDYNLWALVDRIPLDSWTTINTLFLSP